MLPFFTVSFSWKPPSSTRWNQWKRGELSWRRHCWRSPEKLNNSINYYNCKLKSERFVEFPLFSIIDLLYMFEIILFPIYEYTRASPQATVSTNFYYFRKHFRVLSSQGFVQNYRWQRCQEPEVMTKIANEAFPVKINQNFSRFISEYFMCFMCSNLRRESQAQTIMYESYLSRNSRSTASIFLCNWNVLSSLVVFLHKWHT